MVPEIILVVDPLLVQVAALTVELKVIGPGIAKLVIGKTSAIGVEKEVI